MKTKKGLQWNIHGLEVSKTKRDEFGECFLVVKSGTGEELRLLNWSNREILDLAVQILHVALEEG